MFLATSIIILIKGLICVPLPGGNTTAQRFISAQVNMGDDRTLVVQSASLPDSYL